MRKIFYSRVAVKAINSLDNSLKQKIKAGIEGLLEVPPKGDIKQMQGVKPPALRLRIGKYRVLYEYTKLNEVEVLMIKDIVVARGYIQVREINNMPVVSKQIIDMIDMLPESEQKLAFEMIKRIVLAWDSDFTKLTPVERG